MKKLMVGLVVTLVVSLAIAQEELPSPGITPDSPFYGLKKVFERLQLAFAFSPEAKAELRLKFAAKRLAEARAMVERGKPEFVPRLVEEHEEELEKANEIALAARRLGRNVTKLDELIILATSVHIDVLEEVYERVPAEAKGAILKAREASTRGQEEALKRIGEVMPERSAELCLEIAKKRLERARERAREGKYEEARKMVKRYEEMINRSWEMVEMAEAMGRNVSGILEKVSSATSTHLVILQEVYERVPAEAKGAILRAMNVSARGQQEALEALEKISPERAREIEAEMPEEVREIRERMERTEIAELPIRP